MNKKKVIGRALRNVAFILGMSVAFGLLFAFLFGGFNVFESSRMVRSALYSMAIGVIAWSGNEFLTRWAGRRWPWEVNPGATFRRVVWICLLYTSVSISLFNFLYYYPWGAAGVNWQRLGEIVLINSLVAVIITVIILLAVFVNVFMRYWREGLQREEQYKRDLITAQYESLRSHVNPHFLFNSLSVLTSLVETEPPVAVKFIRKLAEVYRYVLDMRDRELVMLSEELSLVHSFLFMQRYRFGDNLQVTIGPMNPAARVVPLSVQMLVENALKHNVVTDHQPLALTLVEEDGWLVCRNNFQPRELIEPSSGTGLQNIAGRLAPFTSRVMTWGVESSCFTVRMPLV